MTGVVPDVTHI